MTLQSGTPAPKVSAVTFTPARPLDVALGLHGFVAFTVDGLRLDGVVLRRTLGGRFVLSYPRRRCERGGVQRAYVRPADDQIRVAIESQVFAVLKSRGAAQ